MGVVWPVTNVITHFQEELQRNDITQSCFRMVILWGLQVFTKIDMSEDIVEKHPITESFISTVV